LAGALPADGVAIQNAESRRAERPGLHDGSAFFEERDQTIKVRLSDGEGRALDGGDALTRLGVAEVEQGGNDKARGAVDLFKEVIIHQYAAIFRRDEVGAATSGDLYFETAAANFSGDGADGVVLSDFPFFQLRDPDAVHTFGFQNADVFIADQARSFFPPDRKMGQHRIRPVDSLTSMVWAFICTSISRKKRG